MRAYTRWNLIKKRSMDLGYLFEDSAYDHIENINFDGWLRGKMEFDAIPPLNRKHK